MCHLVALATATRVGELQALSSHVACQGRNMVLTYLPDFVAKTETPGHPLPREFILSSLTEVVGRQDDERLLCPVRALRWYLERTRNPSRPQHLFLSVKNPGRPLSKAAISFFLRQLIRSAHKDFPDSLAPTLRVRAHDIRGVATSLLWSINRAVSDVMAVACWRTQSVFANHYLSSIQRVQDDVFSIGPIVAAGTALYLKECCLSSPTLAFVSVQNHGEGLLGGATAVQALRPALRAILLLVRVALLCGLITHAQPFLGITPPPKCGNLPK